MTKITAFIRFILLILLIVQSYSLFSKDIYVWSGAGNDYNPGTAEAQLATIERAFQVAKHSAKEQPGEDITIHLMNSRYELKQPLLFQAEEWAGYKGKLTFKVQNEGNAILSGGKKITGWEKNENGLWEAPLETEVSPRELFFAVARRAVRARHPNEGFLRVKEVGADRRTHFFYHENDFPEPASLESLELVLLHDWSISRIRVKSIDQSTQRVTAVDSIGARQPAFFNLDNWEPDPRYYLENALEFLDSDFEWYHDANAGKIYLKLPENLPELSLQGLFSGARVPVLEQLVRFEGTKDQPLKNIHFENIIFADCAWHIPEKGYCGIQACHYDPRPLNGEWAVVPAAVYGTWTENCSFSNCSFYTLGTSGLWLSTGCKNCVVENSSFQNISGNGIMIGEGQLRKVNGVPWWQVTPEDAATGNVIKNCSVSECGQQFFGAVGIWGGLVAETTISNNLVSNLPYTGISIGWMWNPTPTPCRNNVLENNHIHDILNILSDGGGIYMLGLQPGSRLTGNLIHDVKINAGRAESNGMFLDEGTTDVIVADNLIYNIAKSPLRFHKATTNLVKDNFLFCTEGNPPVRYNRTIPEDIEKVNNTVLEKGAENYWSELQKAQELFKPVKEKAGVKPSN